MPATKAKRLSRIAVVLGVGAPALAVLGVLGGGSGVWPPMAAVAIVGGAVVLAVVAVLDALAALWLGRRGGGDGRLAALGLVGGLALIGAWTMQRVADARFPPTHDAATAAPAVPRFLAIRVPEGGSVEDAGVTALRLALFPREAMRRVVALGHASGWHIVAQSNRRLEATDVSSAFGFEDAIVVEMTPVASGVQVGMRSTAIDQSGGDGGRNAARVRGFLKSLVATLHPKPIG